MWRLMLLLIGAWAVLATAASAEPQEQRLYVSADDALARGAEEFCPLVFQASMLQRLGARPARELVASLFETGGFRLSDGAPRDLFFDGHRPDLTFAQAELPEVAPERVFVAVSVSDRPVCDLLALGAPDVSRTVIRRFEAAKNLVRLSTGHAPESGIDMFGMRWANPAADFGVTVYSPVNERTRQLGIGALVTVGLIPKDSIDTGRFLPGR